MAHVLIAGRTRFGKSILSRIMARNLRASGRKVGAYDILSANWDADTITHDREAFLKAFWSSSNMDWFIDEAGETAGRFDSEMIKTATRGRHRGHRCWYIAQRLATLDRNLRAQCTRLYLFNVPPSDAKELANDWGDNALEGAAAFQPGTFYYIAPPNRAAKMRIDWAHKMIVKA